MVSTVELMDKHRGQVDISTGPVSYVDTGGPGRPALFVHGLATSSYLWRNVIAQFDGDRRCVAFDLPLHGSTPAAPGQDFSLPRSGPVPRRVRGRAAAVGHRPRRQRHRRSHLPGLRGGPPGPAADAHADELRGA